MNPKLAFDEVHEQLVHETIAAPWDVAAVQVHAFICIDNTTLGPALGGTRILRYASLEDARVDAIRLARGMTYKMAMLWPDYKVGGGKGVLAVLFDEPTVGGCKSP